METIEDLNNGYIPHRIEDRLGLERGTVSVFRDEERGEGDKELVACIHDTGEEILIFPSDLWPY